MGYARHMAELDQPGHSLLLRYDTENPQFARGFEAGRVWGTLLADPERAITETVHADNAEMFLRMGEATGRPVRSEELDETWLRVHFSPATKWVEKPEAPV